MQTYITVWSVAGTHCCDMGAVTNEQGEHVVETLPGQYGVDVLRTVRELRAQVAAQAGKQAE